MKNNLIFIIILYIFIGCDNPTNKDITKNCKNGCEYADSLLSKFYELKYNYLKISNNEDLANKVELELVDCWANIIENKEVIIPYLLLYKNDSLSYSLYYSDFFINSNWVGSPMPNNLHALYLIECIINNDYLFNKRFCPNCTKKMLFKNDGINFIFSVKKGNYYNASIDRLFFIPDRKLYDEELELAWKYYREWYIFNRKESPLYKTTLVWNSSRFMFLQKKPNFFTEKDSSDIVWHNYFLKIKT